MFGVKLEKGSSVDKALKQLKEKQKKYRIVEAIREKQHWVSKSEKTRLALNRAKWKQKQRELAETLLG
jgi:ribosomal protein S21